MLGLLSCIATALVVVPPAHLTPRLGFAARSRVPRAMREELPDFGQIDQEAFLLAVESQENAREEAAAAAVAVAWRELDDAVSAANATNLPTTILSSADFADVEALREAMATDIADHSIEQRATAAALLVTHRVAIVRDATAVADPPQRGALRRFDADDVPAIEAALRDVARRLLDAPEPFGGDTYAEHPGDAAIAGRAAKYVARRICAPRDVDDASAAAARCALLALAKEAEAYAWSASGGLL